jgi:phosphatidylglycerophosphatase A
VSFSRGCRASTISGKSIVSNITASRVFKDPILLLAFGLGSGLAPKAPGTAGTLAAIPLYLGMSQFSQPVYLLGLLVIALAGIWICGRASARLGAHDHPGIVWDEFAGYLLTMLPASGSMVSILAGFALFRLFDIWKPWPISLADRKVGGGVGIMLDDLLAAIPAAIGLMIIMRFVE